MAGAVELSPSRAGFTLLEMLVALVVFGLVMASLAQSFRFGLTAFSAGPRHAAQPEAMAALDLALAPLIEQALPGSLTGHPDSLSFTTRLPAGAGLAGALADVAITNTPGGTLVLRYTRHPPGIPLVPPPAPLVEPLATGVAGFRAAYLGPQATWTSTWKKRDGTPRLIRLHVDLFSGANWPDLVAAPAP